MLGSFLIVKPMSLRVLWFMSRDQCFIAIHFILGIVFVIFLLCWTPHHVDRIMYIIITMTSSWSGATANAQEWVHLIAGAEK